MNIKQFLAPILGLNVAGIVSVAKKFVLAKAGVRFAQWYSESSYFSSSVGGIMEKSKTRKIQSLLLTLILMVAACWVVPSAAIAQEMVKDPATGEMVQAPRYGGTFTLSGKFEPPHTDIWFGSASSAVPLSAVLDRLGVADWAVDQNIWDHTSDVSAAAPLRGQLAESWETPDATTIIFHIRQGVHWHNKAPMNGRELTVKDVEFHFHRLLGLGSGFTETMQGAGDFVDLPWDSVTATDDGTVVFKLKQPNLDALSKLLSHWVTSVMPPEVIKEHGDVKNWRNLVGTGPFEMKDWVEGSSLHYTKNPDYWGHDEKYPENRLPYVDEVIVRIFPDEATILAALRSRKIDYTGVYEQGAIASRDQIDSLQKTNPELVMSHWYNRSETSFGLNLKMPPFDDIRVRRAMQMALDLETINNTYYKGTAKHTPMGWQRTPGSFIPFAEWPEEIKQYHQYDPEGAKKLLAEAGYPNGFKTVYHHYTPFDLNYYEIANQYFREIGVEVKTRLVDRSGLFGLIRSGDYEGMVTAIQGVAWGNMNPISMNHSSRAGSDCCNYGGTADPDYDAIVDAAAAANTFEEQQRLTREADWYGIESAWLIWGPISPSFVVVQPWLKGFNGENQLGVIDYHRVHARIWIDQELKQEMGH